MFEFCQHVHMCTMSMPCAHSGGQKFTCIQISAGESRKVEQQACLFKGVCLFSGNAEKECGLQPGNPLLSDEPAPPVSLRICFIYPWALLLGLKTHPYEKCHLYFTTSYVILGPGQYWHPQPLRLSQSSSLDSKSWAWSLDQQYPLL